MSIKSKTLTTLKELTENVDYQGWLEIKKRKWKDTLEKRKKQRLNNARSAYNINNKLLGGGRNLKAAQGKIGVNSYFRSPEEALTRCHWQILQLVPSSESGQILAWLVLKE
ncbi:hypothetical protein M0R45_016531 [Rubus argutus]|uniref:DNA polymerase epsilon catalytic subunit n=1 Tax=Rubus argutus TaxID=59490 RepID=A0AAW1XTD0_RUBAR